MEIASSREVIGAIRLALEHDDPAKSVALIRILLDSCPPTDELDTGSVKRFVTAIQRSKEGA